MLINLFYIFDPATSINVFFNLIRSIFVIIILPKIYGLIPFRFILINYLLIYILSNEFQILINKKFNLLNIIIYIRIFIIIIFNF